MRRAAGKDQWLPEARLSRKFYSVIQRNKQALTPNIVLLPEQVQNIFGADEHVGKSYLLYSPTSLFDRIQDANFLSARAEISPHYAVVYFNETTAEWELPSNESLIPFTPAATDLVLALIESSGPPKGPKKREITYFSGTQDHIHGIASGYQSGDLQLIPDRFRGEVNLGEYMLDGTYFIRNSE